MGNQRRQSAVAAPSNSLPGDLANAALDASPDLLFVLDESAAVVYANATARRILAGSHQKLVGAPFSDALDEGSRTKAQRMIQQAAAQPDTLVYELNHRADDGSAIMIAYRAQRIAHSHGQRTLLIGRLLTDTIATTERLVALNRRLSALFSIATTTTRSIRLSEMLNRVLRVALGELDLQAGAIFLVDPEPSNAASGRLELMAQDGFSARFLDRIAQIDLQTQFRASLKPDQHPHSAGVQQLDLYPDDLIMPAGPLLSAAVAPLYSDDRIIGWLYAVTDRYRALGEGELELLNTIGHLLGPPIANARLHEELVLVSGRLQSVLDTIDSGVVLIDDHGIVRFANPRLGDIFGIDVSTWPGQPYARLLPPTLHALPVAGDEARLWELTGPQHRVLQRFSEDVYIDGPQPVGSIEVFSDVTQLQEMNRLKDEFVAAAAHDLKTPVTAIKGYAQIALRLAQRGADKRLTQSMAMINARSSELTHLMDALLDMSRIQAGRILLNIETFALHELIEQVVGHFEFDLRRRDRDLEIDLPGQPLIVSWDRTRIEGVLINVVGNAIKYSPDGGAILIAARQQRDDRVALTVTDYGIGIPADERSHIFERFYRVPSVVEHGFKGTGIGLYISHSIVRLHHGRIWASDALHGGGGTTMHIELPISVEPSSAEAH